MGFDLVIGLESQVGRTVIKWLMIVVFANPFVDVVGTHLDLVEQPVGQVCMEVMVVFEDAK